MLANPAQIGPRLFFKFEQTMKNHKPNADRTKPLPTPLTRQQTPVAADGTRYTHGPCGNLIRTPEKARTVHGRKR